MATACMRCGVEFSPRIGSKGPAVCPPCRVQSARERPAAQAGVDSGARFRERPANLAMGEVFRQTLGLWSRNLGPFLVLTFLVRLPLFLYAIYFILQDPEAVTKRAAETFDRIQQFGGLLLNALVTAVVVYQVFQNLRGANPSFGDTFRKGMARLVPALWTSVLSFIIFVLPMIPGIALMGAGAAGNSAGAALAGSVLMLVGVIGALVLYFGFFVGIVASVVEGLNGWPALKRSLQLTKGSKSRIFSVAFVVGLAGAGLTLVVQAFASWQVVLLYHQVYAMLISSASAVFATVIYYRLRSAKEGIGIEDLAGVFD